ncbi:MAG: DUF2490 domain-containing protein [Sphingobacteriales bacterium]|nr:MAG: DUF2490 domain-containing protein [Sphingobacteriales bacterium]
MSIKVIFLMMMLCFCSMGSLRAQRPENAGWFFLSNSKQISEKLDFIYDIQIRSADRFDYVNTLLLRGAFSYNLSKKHSVALGYAYKADWNFENDVPTFSPEHRIYEQYLLNSAWGNAEIDARFRLEQRFIREDKLVDFSQRARLFLSLQVPLIADTSFSKGFYAKIQNEIFMNVQHKEKVNNNIFDQNRVSSGLGFRFSKNLDVDFSYMFWYQKEMERSSKTNVFQLMLSTKF